MKDVGQFGVELLSKGITQLGQRSGSETRDDSAFLVAVGSFTIHL